MEKDPGNPIYVPGEISDDSDEPGFTEEDRAQFQADLEAIIEAERATAEDRTIRLGFVPAHLLFDGQPHHSVYYGNGFRATPGRPAPGPNAKLSVRAQRIISERNDSEYALHQLGRLSDSDERNGNNAG